MRPADTREGAEPWTRSDWLICATLFLLTLLSRIPFRTGLLYAWDSVLYTRAIEDFDVTLHQPQPPGHIFYVGLVWLVNQMTGDANAAMVWVSVFASAAAVAALYWLGGHMFNRTVGLLSALFLATSLSFWAHGVLAYPYTLLAFLGIVVAGLCWRAREGSPGYLLLSTICLGVAAGFRQDLLFFMLPLWIGAMFGKPLAHKSAAAALLALTTAAWYIPSAVLSGGFASYRQASSAQTDYLLKTDSVFYNGLPALGDNLQLLGEFVLYALAAASVLAAYYLAGIVVKPGVGGWRDRRLLFLALWVAPSTFFYIFMHIGEYGYVFTFLPAVLIMAAQGAVLMARDIRGWTGRRIIGDRGGIATGALVVAVPLLVLNIALFLVFSPPLSARRLAANEDIQRSRIEVIRESFDPGSTLIVSVFNYQQALYYLPGYQHWYIDPVTAVRPVMGLPPGMDRVVLFDESLEPVDRGEAQSLPLAHEQQLFYLETEAEKNLLVDWPARWIMLE